MSRFKEVATFRKRIMAEMAADLLKSEGIPAVVQGIEPGMFGPAQHHPVFSARLMVPADALEEARHIVAHLMDDYTAPPSNDAHDD